MHWKCDPLLNGLLLMIIFNEFAIINKMLNDNERRYM